MKLDQLEKFVTEHREEFDTDIPSLKAWRGIEKELDAKEQKAANRFSRWRTMRIAAAVVLLLITGGLIGSFITQSQYQPSNAVAAIDLNDIAPELEEMEAYYQSQVQEKVQMLASYEENDAGLLEDLEELDAWREELKADLIDAPEGSEEEIISDIIRSYQTKIEILEHVLSRIQAASNQNVEENEVSI